MKQFNKLVSGCILCFITFYTYAQEYTFKGTQHGVYFEFKNLQQLSEGYHVLRANEGSEDYQRVGSFYPTRSSSELHLRMTENNGYFRDNVYPTYPLADTLWKIWLSPEPRKILQLQSPSIHLSLGISFLDTSAVLHKKYRYRLDNLAGKNLINIGNIQYEKTVPLFAAMVNTLNDAGESVPRLDWRSPKTNAATLVDLWRKISGTSSPFETLLVPAGISSNTKGDSLIYTFADTTALLGVKYDYYITGRDALDNISKPSDTVSLQVGGRRNIKAAFNVWTKAVDNGIRLSWEPLEQQYALQNIVIIRSEIYDSGYELLSTIPVTDTAYTDYAISAGKTYYYQLLVQGESNFSQSSPRTSGIYYGLVRLLPPQNVSAFMGNNNPQISWTYADTTNIRGFYIYRTYALAQPLQQISELIPAIGSHYIYNDTAKTNAGTTAYYTVAAVSSTQSLGPASSVVTVNTYTPADYKVPSTRQLRFIWLDNQRVSITWLDVSQTEAGISAYQVYRKKTEAASFGEVPVSETENNEFVDTLKQGESWIYAVKTKGERNQLSAFSPTLQIDAPLNRLLAPSDIRLSYSEGKVFLLWNGNINKNKVSKFHIYRSTQTEKPERIATISNDNEELHYTDSKLKKGATYYYTISSVDPENIESPKSEELFVQIP